PPTEPPSSPAPRSTSTAAIRSTAPTRDLVARRTGAASERKRSPLWLWDERIRHLRSRLTFSPHPEEHCGRQLAGCNASRSMATGTIGTTPNVPPSFETAAHDRARPPQDEVRKCRWRDL